MSQQVGEEMGVSRTCLTAVRTAVSCAISCTSTALLRCARAVSRTNKQSFNLNQSYSACHQQDPETSYEQGTGLSSGGIVESSLGPSASAYSHATPSHSGRQGTKLRSRELSLSRWPPFLQHLLKHDSHHDTTNRQKTVIQPGAHTWSSLSIFSIFQRDHLWALLLPTRPISFPPLSSPSPASPPNTAH